MKAFGYFAAAVSMLACIGVWVAVLLVPMSVQPVQSMVEPYVCSPGWTLTLESHSCESSDGSTGTCSNPVCISPDGSIQAIAWKLIAFDLVTFFGMMLFIGIMTLWIVRSARRDTQNLSGAYGTPGSSYSMGGASVMSGLPGMASSPGGSGFFGMADIPGISIVNPDPNVFTSESVQVHIGDMKTTLEDQLTKLEKLRESGMVSEEQYQMIVAAVRQAYDQLK